MQIYRERGARFDSLLACFFAFNLDNILYAVLCVIYCAEFRDEIKYQADFAKSKR